MKEKIICDQGMDYFRSLDFGELKHEHVAQVRRGDYSETWKILAQRIEAPVNFAVFAKHRREEAWLEMISRLPKILDAYQRRIDPSEDSPERLWVFVDGETKMDARRFVRAFYFRTMPPVWDELDDQHEYRHTRRLEPRDQIDEADYAEALEHLGRTLTPDQQITLAYLLGETIHDLASLHGKSHEQIKYIVRRDRQAVLCRFADAVGEDLPANSTTHRRIYARRANGSGNVQHALPLDGTTRTGFADSRFGSNLRPAC